MKCAVQRDGNVCSWKPGSIEKWRGIILTQAAITEYMGRGVVASALLWNIMRAQFMSVLKFCICAFFFFKSTLAAHFLLPGDPARSLSLSLSFTHVHRMFSQKNTQGCLPGLVLYQIKLNGARLSRSVAFCTAACSDSMWRLSSSRVLSRRNNATLSRPGAPGRSYACEVVD